MISYKTANRLFRGQYQYKVVLIVPGASMFRSGKMNVVLRLLSEVDLDRSVYTATFYRSNIKNNADLDYCHAVRDAIEALQDFEMRVESPWLTVYTNSQKDVDLLVSIDEERVKYVSRPAANTVLEAGTIILPKVDFEYKVSLSSTRQDFSAFVEWAETNTKVQLTNSCINALSKNRSFGGSYFYITGEKNLLLAKMHLGGSINKIERILKA